MNSGRVPASLGAHTTTVEDDVTGEMGLLASKYFWAGGVASLVVWGGLALLLFELVIWLS